MISSDRLMMKHGGEQAIGALLILQSPKLLVLLLISMLSSRKEDSARSIMHRYNYQKKGSINKNTNKQKYESTKKISEETPNRLINIKMNEQTMNKSMNYCICQSIHQSTLSCALLLLIKLFSCFLSELILFLVFGLLNIVSCTVVANCEAP